MIKISCHVIDRSYIIDKYEKEQEKTEVENYVSISSRDA